MRTLKDFIKTLAVQPFCVETIHRFMHSLIFCDEKTKICQSNPIELIPYILIVRYESLNVHLSFVIFISIPDLLSNRSVC